MPLKHKKQAPPHDENIIFFYMPDAERGELCQWYPSTFSVSKSTIASLVSYSDDEPTTSTDPQPADDELITFTCAEQFMMYCKAARFHDIAAQRKIMATTDPKAQKSIGKTITGFYDASWDEVKSDVVVAGNMAKFGQNSKLKAKLLNTGEKMLVEAASKDRVWGIGFNANQALHHRDQWGENRLGKALMLVRGRLREQETGSQEEGKKAVSVGM
ncbi:hypothetical protein OQA88_2989 [Cercophora sp. LCS_1]